MAQAVAYGNEVLSGKVEETHISWVILTRKYAIKIKKPVRLSFLDFSTLGLRRQLCEREMRLNNRFSNIYLAVLPVRLIEKQWVIGGDSASEIIDYCVVMARLATSKRLDNVLRSGYPTVKLIRSLGFEIAAFHQRADKILTPFSSGRAQDTFNEIKAFEQLARDKIGPQFGDIIKYSIDKSNVFLEEHKLRIAERIEHGMQRDVHGDLHCANIFLYKKPILFDCIEFNDEYRQIDVLYELAFLCMDMERFGQRYLSEILLKEYLRHFPAMEKKEDYRLLVYYKSLRANIRARVHAMQLQQSETEAEAFVQIAEIRNYLSLMSNYMTSISPHGARLSFRA